MSKPQEFRVEEVQAFQKLQAFQKENPRDFDLAEALGGEIRFSDGDYWFWQDGLSYKLDAPGILEQIMDARKQPRWGSQRTRAMRLLEVLTGACIEADSVLFAWRHSSGDFLCVESDGSGKMEVAISLAGEPERFSLRGNKGTDFTIEARRRAAEWAEKLPDEIPANK